LRQDNHLSALQPGARLHSYTVGTILGAGGFGITYKAHEDITNRDVAIKEYLPTAFAVRDRDGATVRPLSEGSARDFEWGLERFREEAKLLIGFRHPNIVPVLAYFEANGTGYLVMAFQDGTSLAEVLRKSLTLSEAQLLEFMVPLLDGVEEVHRHNFLHRDIKPENIFIRGDGTPVLLDFGAARLALGDHSKTFTTLLTEGYAPFEQYAGTGNQGPWSDIYALAAVMFRCLVGKPPAEAPRRAVAKLRGIPDPMAQDFADLRSRVTSDLAFAVEAALRVVEQERPQSIAALRELIVAPRSGANTERLAPAPAPAPPPASAATLIPDVAHRITARHPPPWAAPERRRPRRTGRYVAFAAIVLAGASAAAYVGDQRSWLPDAFQRAGPDATPATTSTAGVETDAVRRKADDAARRASEEKRRAEQQARQEDRNKGFAEYQRLQLDHIEAERRQYFEARKAESERRKSEDPNAASDPDNPSATSPDRARIEAERKRLEEEQARRGRTRPAQPAPRSGPEQQRPEARQGQDQRREFETWPPEPPDMRREVAPSAPPSLRRPSDAQRYGPYSPPARGQPPRWNDPNYEDDY
jgi:serine/threonine protein kinase